MKPIISAAARNGKAFPCSNMTAKQFILSYPRGAYTSARTVNAHNIFDYDYHIQRLVESSAGMQLSTSNDLESHLRPRIDATLREAMRDFHRQHSESLQSTQEFKLTILVCENEQRDAIEPVNILCHIGLLPLFKKNRVKLRVTGKPRKSPNVKDTIWVRERQNIYDLLPEDVEEILLLDSDSHEIFEGSQTNFFVIRDEKVFTAGDGILFGTVRALVLEQCQKEGIPVVFKAPKLMEIGDWEACFITSTSRLVLGVHVIEYPRSVDDSQLKEWNSAIFDENHVLLSRIRELVRDSIVAKSTKVFA